MLTICPGGCAMPGAGCLPSSHRPCPASWSEADRPLLPLAGSIQPLSSQSLRASSSTGIDPHHLFYRVVRGPRLGRLFHTQQGSTGEALENFTQAEVRTTLYSHRLDSIQRQVAHSAPGHTCRHGYQLQPRWQPLPGAAVVQVLHAPPSKSYQAGRADGA